MRTCSPTVPDPRDEVSRQRLPHDDQHVTLCITIAAFVGVAALVGGVAMLLRGESDKDVEAAARRAHRARPSEREEGACATVGVLADSLDDGSSFVAGDAHAVRQACDCCSSRPTPTLTPSRFFLISSGLAVFGGIAPLIWRLSGRRHAARGRRAWRLLPLLWLMYRRNKRHEGVRRSNCPTPWN